MILIGEDQKEAAQRLIDAFGTGTHINYLIPGGGGKHYTPDKIASQFDNHATRGGEPTAFILDLSPEPNENIEWGLTVVQELAKRLHGNMWPDNLYELLSDNNFLFVLHTKHYVTEEDLKNAWSIDPSKIDYWQPFNRNSWMNSSVPKPRQRPFLMYTRQLTDDRALVEKVKEWLM